MRPSVTSIILAVLPVTLASPTDYSRTYKHTHSRHPWSSGVSGGPFESATSAPYGLSNTTIIGSTGQPSQGLITATLTTTIQTTIYETITDTAPLQSASEAGSSVVASSDSSCGAAVTVTFVPTTTITITGSAVPSDSSIASTGSSGQVPVQSASGTVAGSSVAPVSLSSQISGASQAATSTTSTSSNAPVTASSSSAAEAGTSTTPTSSVTSISQPSSSTSFTGNTASVVTYGSAPAVASSSSATSTTLATSSASSPATSPSTSPTTSPSSGGASGGSKRGVIIPAGGADQASLVTAFNNAEKISWVGNWYSSGPPNLDSHIDFVPQMYGKQSNTDGTWTKNAQKAEAAGQKYFLSFGEPETTNAQLYMDASDAVTFWMQQMEPYAANTSIGAPGVLQNTQDFTWLSQFLDGCEQAGCNIGFIAIHWFWVASPDHEQGFKDVVNNATALAKGKPVWVDNFQATGTNEAQQAFLGDIVPWLDQNESVERYAYVSPDRTTGTGFLNSDGSISSLGTFYANL